ncbi:aspartate-tRNA ligase [Sphaceloma murrayae]|uniref:Aspartate-tRNA ligase n=1 Tax=Sphaceloma murrayae TaxID=2082308 RepID=A0A2K1QQ10_9PEZI|nr:aspartate-tRNA ligase [Sphaceloma murrayae]
MDKVVNEKQFSSSNPLAFLAPTGKSPLPGRMEAVGVVIVDLPKTNIYVFRATEASGWWPPYGRVASDEHREDAVVHICGNIVELRVSLLPVRLQSRASPYAKGRWPDESRWIGGVTDPIMMVLEDPVGSDRKETIHWYMAYRQIKRHRSLDAG